MPKHVARLLLLITAAAVAAVAARYYLLDPSYYRYGHFRGDAPAEIAADVHRRAAGARRARTSRRCGDLESRRSLILRNGLEARPHRLVLLLELNAADKERS